MTILSTSPKLAAFFHPDAISADTRAVNRQLSATLAALTPPPDLAAMRNAYEHGRMGLPALPKSPSARTLRIQGLHGDIALRVLVPDEVRGAYLHIHGGGWMLGTNDMQDGLLERIGMSAGLATVSVDYRLAPEHPYPVPLDDCVAAAEWLIDNAQDEFGTSWLAIGGESAGAHLSASTLIRLRDAGRVGAYRAANLAYGCFDLSLTPSMHRAAGAAFIDRATVEAMAAGYKGAADARDPGVSPIYADLAGLPPAFFTVGTIDPLLDDTLFMHMRWLAAGSDAELALYPGGVHGFNLLDGEIANAANAAIGRFLNAARSGT